MKKTNELLKISKSTETEEAAAAMATSISPSSSSSAPSFSSSSSSASSSSSPPYPVFALSFNQDHGCISCGTSLGYRVFQSDPLQELFRREFDASGWGKPFISMRSPSNVSADRPRPHFQTPGQQDGQTLGLGLGTCSSEGKNIAQEGGKGDSSERRSGYGDGCARSKGSGGTNVHAAGGGKRNAAANANGCTNGDGEGNGSRNGNSNSDDGFTVVEMLYRTNMVALVSPKYALNKVILWDDHEGICTGELLFRSAVRAVRLRSDRIVVVLEHRVCVYGISDLRLLHQIDTISNARGICALSPSPELCVLACPGQKKGEVRITLYDSNKSLFLDAHTSAIACISVSLDGSIIATASTKGTLVRLFRSADGSKIQELRRGADHADIHCIAFSCTNHWLAVSSDKGTIHIFCVNEDPSIHKRSAMSSSSHFGFPLSLPSNLTSSISSGLQLACSSFMSLAHSNTGSSLSFMKGMLPSYFSSEWSLSQYRLPERTHALVAFGKEENSIIVLCANASYYKCSFDPVRGGEMRLEVAAKLFDAPFVQ